MMKACLKILGALAVLTGASSAFGQNVQLRADVQYVDQPLSRLTFMQRATPDLRVYIRQNGTAYTVITNHTCKFYYGTGLAAATFTTVTNRSVTPASGYFDLRFLSSDTATNGSFWYCVMFIDSGGRNYYAGTGAVDIVRTTVTGSHGTNSWNGLIDWSAYTFLYGTNFGPYKVGTGGIAFGPADSRGRIPINFNSTLAGVVLTNRTITAGSGLMGGGSLDANRTISHADTSSQVNITGTNGVVVQKLSFDGFGHVLTGGVYNLDNRYFTEAETRTEISQSNNVLLARINGVSNYVGNATNNVDRLAGILHDAPTTPTNNYTWIYSAGLGRMIFGPGGISTNDSQVWLGAQTINVTGPTILTLRSNGITHAIFKNNRLGLGGNTNPSNTLDVAGSGHFTQTLTLNTNLVLWSRSPAYEQMLIGTNSGTATLHIRGRGTRYPFRVDAAATDNDTDDLFSISNDGTVYISPINAYASVNGLIISAANAGIAMSYNGVGAPYIAAACQAAGVDDWYWSLTGTTSSTGPSLLQRVNDGLQYTNRWLWKYGDSDAACVSWFTNSSIAVCNNAPTLMNLTSNGISKLILKNGRLGVGVSTPTQSVDVAGSGHFNGGLLVERRGITQTGITVSNFLGTVLTPMIRVSGTNDVDRFTVYGNGQVVSDAQVVASPTVGGLYHESALGWTLTIGAGTNKQGYAIVTNFSTSVATDCALTKSNITVTPAGTYAIGWQIAHEGAGGGETYEACIFTNGFEDVAFESRRKTSSSDTGSFSAGNVRTLPAGCKIDLRVKASDGTASTMKIRKAQVYAHRLN